MTMAWSATRFDQLHGSRAGGCWVSFADHAPQPAVLETPERRHILLPLDGTYRPFARLFGEFLQRLVVKEQPRSSFNLGGCGQRRGPRRR
ncbi:MAG: hypothetical protein R3A10_18420 [Caldilineaceae bacterium]